LRQAWQRLSLHEAVDAPLVQSNHWPNSFWPRGARTGEIEIDERFGSDIACDLRARGHQVKIVPHEKLGRACAVMTDGREIHAAATTRLAQAEALTR